MEQRTLDFKMKRAFPLIVRGVVDPAGILPKFHNADRWEIRGNVSHYRNQAFQCCSSYAECCNR